MDRVTVHVKMPFRLDLVMGGVSDLSFWSDRNGDCLSLACHVCGKAIQMEGKCIPDQKVYLSGFKSSCVLQYSWDEIEKLDVSQLDLDIQMGIATLQVALEIIQQKRGRITNGLYINNYSIRQKGMGGSSVLAASLITLVCALFDIPKPNINEVVRYVADVEKRCGSNGGWEDVAGSYYPRINRVKYRPNVKNKLSIESLSIRKESLETLQNCLLLIDSGVSASTGRILKTAYETFQENPNQVIMSTEIIRNECTPVLAALKHKDMAYLGSSLNKQRKQWGSITKGSSFCKQMDNIIKPLNRKIYGYREAGAGGGGAVLVVCKEGLKEEVMQELSVHGIIKLCWETSDYGLELYEGGIKIEY